MYGADVAGIPSFGWGMGFDISAGYNPNIEWWTPPPSKEAKEVGQTLQIKADNEKTRKKGRKATGRNPLAIVLKDNTGPGVNVAGSAATLNTPR